MLTVFDRFSVPTARVLSHPLVKEFISRLDDESIAAETTCGGGAVSAVSSWGWFFLLAFLIRSVLMHAGGHWLKDVRCSEYNQRQLSFDYIMKRIFPDVLAVTVFFVLMAAFSGFEDMRTTSIQTILFGLLAVPLWRFIDRYLAKKRWETDARFDFRLITSIGHAWLDTSPLPPKPLGISLWGEYRAEATTFCTYPDQTLKW